MKTPICGLLASVIVFSLLCQICCAAGGIRRGFQPWAKWSPCSRPCNGGEQFRIRLCEPGPGQPCVGNTRETRPCNTHRCSGTWTGWTAWGVCSVTCGNGQQTRQRFCPGVYPCDGPPKETQPCNQRSCFAMWQDWASWSQCTRSCGGGTHRRIRFCSGPGPCPAITRSGFRTITYFAAEDLPCNTQPCAGEWLAWQAWSLCSTTCGPGRRERQRICPAASTRQSGLGVHINGCVGSSTESETCERMPCLKTWQDWNEWTACSATCGGGDRKRTRVCNGGGTQPCIGGTTAGEQSERCNIQLCPMSQWTDWNEWSVCPVTCGGGQRKRTRICNGDGVGKPVTECLGGLAQSSQTDRCNIQLCPVPKWGEWMAWSACPVTCGGGDRKRTRICNGEGPLKPVADCPGGALQASQTVRCNIQLCPMGQWTDWTEWSICPVSCGGGQRKRTRLCNGNGVGKPVTQCLGGLAQSSQTDRCNIQLCPVPKWGEWMAWSACPVTCGGGDRKRTRICNGDGPLKPVSECPGGVVQSSQSDRCNIQLCPPSEGKWAAWNEWSKCSKSCDGGMKRRTRACNDELRNGHVKPVFQCTGGFPASVDSAPCNQQPCHRPRAWTEWGEWSTCSKSCGGGQRKRTRLCREGNGILRAAPFCPGGFSLGGQIEKCNTQVCPKRDLL